MPDNKSHNITIDIQGKSMSLKADFNVYNSHGNIICLAMYIGDSRMLDEVRDKYFKSNYKSIKKAWHKRFGETG